MRMVARSRRGGRSRVRSSSVRSWGVQATGRPRRWLHVQASALKILFVTNDRDARRAGRMRGPSGLEIEVSSFTFEDLVRFRRAPAEGAVLNRTALEHALAETERFDGVFAEAPEAVLLDYVRRKRGMRPLRWLVNVVQLLARVQPLRAAILRRYGDDPLALAAADPRLCWGVTTRAHVAELARLGLPPERIVFHPSTTAIQVAFAPGAAAALAEDAPRALPASLADVADAALVAGTNNRDLATVCAAAERARVCVHILTDRRRDAPVSSAVRYHDPVPLADFVAAVAHARLLVVPLRAGDASCGQQTIAIAQHVRTLVLASDVPAVRDYVTHGESGLLVAPEDPAALAAALRGALAAPPEAALVEAGYRRNARDGELVPGLLRRIYLDPLG
ncbi:MAG: glycosyltransferase [Polyangiaceae bacterium]|nr:glycosyltransferase [Polyangiaceae bacterium]